MSTPSKKEFGDAVVRQFDAYAKLFQAQVEVTQEPPRRFHFPEPANEVERTAMRLLIEMVEEKSKTPVQIVHSE